MINRDNEIKIPEAWMTMIKKHNSRRAMRQRTTKGGKQIRKIQSEPWNFIQSRLNTSAYRVIWYYQMS